MMFSASANAQITYTNISPDTTPDNFKIIKKDLFFLLLQLQNNTN